MHIHLPCSCILTSVQSALHFSIITLITHQWKGDLRVPSCSGKTWCPQGPWAPNSSTYACCNRYLFLLLTAVQLSRTKKLLSIFHLRGLKVLLNPR